MRRSTAGLVIATVVLIAYAAAVAWAYCTNRIQVFFLLVAVAANLAVFISYAVDKSAARKEGQRISESTLHILELLGGWPSALLAQQLLRHKTRKLSFQLTFYLVALLNTAALAIFIFPEFPVGALETLLKSR